MKTCRALLKEGEEKLKAAGIEEAQNDARLLFLHVFRTDLASLLLHYPDSTAVLPAGTEEAYRDAISRRAAREPLQYITGEQDFCGIAIRVDPRVLIPRFDTEVLVQTVLQAADGGDLLDLCTGSGCIAAALGKLGHFTSVTAADLSPGALSVAAENLTRAGVMAEVVRSDLFSALPGRRFDVITANPPYIPTDVIGTLSPEVREHEPKEALDGSADGLAFYRRLAAECPAHLKAGGHVFFEIGSDQKDAVEELLSNAGFSDLICVKDLSGHDRVVSGVKAEQDGGAAKRRGKTQGRPGRLAGIDGSAAEQDDV